MKLWELCQMLYEQNKELDNGGKITRIGRREHVYYEYCTKSQKLKDQDGIEAELTHHDIFEADDWILYRNPNSELVIDVCKELLKNKDVKAVLKKLAKKGWL